MQIDLTVEAATLDTGNKTRDRHLRSEHFFDVDAHPLVRFTSTSVEEGDGTISVSGYLEAAGRRIAITLPAPPWSS